MAKITALTANTSLASGDLLVVVDIDDATMAATGTDKKLTCTQLLSLPATNVQSSATPAGTTSTTLVMMGLGSSFTLTPASSGKVLVLISGGVTTATAAVTVSLGGRFGTGAAPANGAAVTGTAFGTVAAQWQTQAPAAGAFALFCMQQLITGLVAGTAYWFDLALATSNAADAASLASITFSAVEVA